jgi:type III secretion system YscD/HrpQ family protein
MSVAAKKLFRVVGGAHEGAKVPLAPGEYIIGSSEECDIILRDAAVAARHVVLTVGRATASVRLLERNTAHYRGRPLRGQRKMLADYDIVGIGDAEFCLHPPAGESAPADAGESTARQANIKRRGASRVPYLTLGLALMAAGTWFAYATVTKHHDQLARTAARTQMERTLARMNLPDVRVAADRGGAVALTGFVPSREDAKRLTREKGLLTPTAAQMHFHVASDLVARVKEHVDDPNLKIDYVGGGKIRVEGATERSAVKEKLKRLSGELKGVAALEDRVTIVVPPPAPATPEIHALPFKIIGVYLGAMAHFQAEDGARYFPGGTLPDGAMVVSIDEAQILFRKDGKQIAYALDEGKAKP